MKNGWLDMASTMGQALFLYIWICLLMSMVENCIKRFKK